MPVDAVEHSESQPRLGEVVTAFLEALGDGLVPDRRALLAEHSDLSPELEEFFAAQDEVAFLTAPLRAVASAAKFPSHDSELDSAPDPRLIAVLGSRGYELLGAHARGGTAVVHKARHRRLNRLAAIKTIGVGRQVSPLDLERFRNEAETLGSLSHPNIVPVYEVAEHDGRLFLFMPYLEGGSLADNIASYRDDPRKTAKLVATVARAIDHAHRHGILHRDMKPSNILLDRSGQPHVSDFGLALRLDMDSDLTVTGAIVGTPSFMAPEQAQGRRSALTTSTDVHGLSAVLYTLLTGQPPFRGETTLDTIEMVRNTAPTSPRMLNPRLDRDLDTICLKCLEKEPQARYGSALALADDLERWLAGEPIAARPISPMAVGWRWARRNPLVASLITSVAALFVAGIFGVLISNFVLERKNAEVIRQRDIARTQQRLARQAVDTFFTNQVENWLRFKPAMEEKQVELLDAALRYYEEIARADDSDPTARDDVARAALRMGNIRVLLNRIDMAESAFGRAIAVCESRIRTEPIATSTHAIKVEALIDLANAHRKRMDKDGDQKAERLHRQAIELCQAAAEQPENAEFRYLMARAYSGLANILHTNGDKHAVECAQHAVDLSAELCSRFPREPKYLEHLGVSQLQLGRILYLTGRQKDAFPHLQSARATYDQLLTASPSDPEYRGAQAAALHSLALILHERGDLKEAEMAYRGAIELRERLAADFPAFPENRLNLVKHYMMLAALLDGTRRFDNAEEFQQKGVQVAEALVQDFHETAEFRLLRAECRLSLGTFLYMHGTSSRAEEFLRSSLSELDTLPQRYAERAEFLSVWAKTAYNLGLLLREKKQTDASAMLKQAFEHQEKAARATHGDPGHYELLLRLAAAHAEQLFSQRDDDEALRLIDRMSQPPEEHAANYFHLALFQANWSGGLLATSNLNIPDSRRRDLARLYADSAINNLRMAVKAGFKDLSVLNAQRALDSLRDRSDYKAIIANLEVKLKVGN